MVGAELFAGEHLHLAGADVGRRQKQLDHFLLAHPLEIDLGVEQIAQRIHVERIELIGRQNAAQSVDKNVVRRLIEAEIRVHLIQEGRRDEARGSHLGHLLPESLQPFARALAAVERQAVGEHDGIDAAGAGRGDAVEADALVFQQAIEHAPSEGAVAAAALERQIDGLLTYNRLAMFKLAWFGLRSHGFPHSARCGSMMMTLPPFLKHQSSTAPCRPSLPKNNAGRGG